MTTPQTPPTVISSPPERLEGLELPNGRRVERTLARVEGSTGGVLSVGYETSREGSRAFVKALDFVTPLPQAHGRNQTAMLQLMTAAHLFEVELLRRCSERGLRHVVMAVDSGEVAVDPSQLLGTVPYVVFELADSDIRTAVTIGKRFSFAAELRMLQMVALGVLELHSVGIAHQDLKPSNVLLFGQQAKIADLGRAVCRGLTAPHESISPAGDRSWAPPELLYGAISKDWNEKCLACDLYLFGSLIAFLLSGFSSNGLLVAELAPELHWEQWQGSFGEVLPYLQQATTRVEARLATLVPEPFSELA